MEFETSLLVLAAVFVVGFGIGYSFRAAISANHRRTHERSRGYPLPD
jgi:hypothetical protein